MADYDLVIIGGSPVGRYAAVRAIHQGAKHVALVEPPTTAATSLFDVLAPHAINQLEAVAQQFLLPPEYATAISATAVSQWAKNVIANIDEQNSPATLSALGVDVIISSGEFTSQQPLIFSVSDRQLLGRSYLIATGARPAIPDIAGLHSTNYLTIKTIWQQLDTPNSGKDWVIIGGNPDSVMLAQSLTKLGCNVTLIVNRAQIVAGLDADIVQLLQAILEAEGIRILTATPVSQVKQIGRKKWIQAGDRAIEADEVLICAGYQPNTGDLDLEKVGVKSQRQGIKVNSLLQTTNPHIYACGDVIGGYPFANIANYEARVAVNNGLLLPRLKVDYRSIPWAIFSQPQVAHVGLNEAKAKNFYSDVLVIKKYFKSVTAAQLSQKTTGICKLVVRRNGEILGATIVGFQASELINVISLALVQKIKLDAIAQVSPIYPIFSEIFEQIDISDNFT